MRRSSATALVVSALVHVGALGVAAVTVVVGRPTETETETETETVPIEVETIDGLALQKPPADVVAVDVVALTSPSPSPSPSPSRSPSPSPSPFPSPSRSGSMLTSTTATGAAEVAPPTAAKPVPSALPDVEDVIAKIAAGGKPMPPPMVTSGRVDQVAGGRAKIVDGVTTVSIDKDGSAHFHDKPSFEVHLLPGLGSLGEIDEDAKKALDEWVKDPYNIVKKVGRAQDLPEHVLAEPGAADSYGLTPPSDGSEERTGGTVTLLGGKFDVTDWAMRKLGMDPYAARKTALLETTFAERAERGAVYRQEQLDHSAELVRRNLEALWASTGDAAARKEALFEMWDECAEGDDSAGVAGQRARLEVVGWIRAKLPAGSVGAYSATELAQLSGKRTSKQLFAPYDDD